jgi:hypothetical protein
MECIRFILLKSEKGFAAGDHARRQNPCHRFFESRQVGLLASGSSFHRAFPVSQWRVAMIVPGYSGGPATE